MWRVIRYLLALFVATWVFGVSGSDVRAGGGDLVCGCEWEQINCQIDSDTGDHVCSYSCPCGSGGGTCDAGYYRCNTGCCQVGTGDGCECGTKADGSCNPCGGGGGGAYGYPTCGGSQVLKCGNDPVLYLGGGGGNTNDVNLASCAYRGTCGDSYFPSVFTETGCDGKETKGQCQTNCGCCEAGDNYTKSTVTGSNYTREVSCFLSIPSLYCNDWDDTFVSRSYGTGAGNCYCNCENEDGCGANCTRGGNWVKNDMITCASKTTTWSCVDACASTAPTNLSVAQGASATAATLSWTSGTGGSYQVIYVGSDQNSVNNDCAYGGCVITGAQLAPFYPNSNFSYPVTGLSPNTTYYFRVVTHENSSCRPSATTSYTAPDLSLSGRVYLDTNNNCSTATPWSLGGLTVTVRGTAYTGSVGSDGRFAFYGGATTPISYLDLAGFSSAYTPSTATGCNSGSTLTSVTNPSSTNYFYLTSLRESWWQARGAGVYANGNVRSELPSSAENLIEAGVGGELGALMRTSGSVDTGAGGVSPEGYTAQTRYRGKTMNYDFFAAQLGVTPNTVNDWVADTMNKPTNNPEKVFYYLNPSGSEASVTTPWTVANGESYVILVNGDLRIASNITVTPGGFLAFIVNGNVRVSPAVTDIQGLFDLDGLIITESNGGTDVAADFEGSVVAWGGVNFGRDLGANNVSTPGESFVHRADLLVNMPESMKVFALKWEEVVPGTF